MDLSELYKTYSRIRKNQATPRQMLKLVIYAVMNRIYSSRDIQKACKRDINFMYLLEGMPAPDHATIARFISLHFSACAKVLLAQMSDLLYLLGEISGKTIFIDGTKIESAANKYTFVWKRAITKNQDRIPRPDIHPHIKTVKEAVVPHKSAGGNCVCTWNLA